MFLESHVWLCNQVHIVVSESIEAHKRTISELKAQGGVCLSDQCQENTLGSVIVNGKKSVWPLTKSEGLKANG
ncbi:hypothetical protein ACH95_14170 [Bacillus glycinifermentans]|uniref:hypothetical protein n=1 Tax=Bacillus glycinifermentans TaxID=1664069 RepID=UPI0006533490|nr:hypothetical protein [Bacillus glycinifermentans]KMM58274.1 hypothetical protein ACH95_14170 [Bacillus glycinifermentans]MEC0493693.1 hypothetical protein [Bacillus glycinifermentans]MEC0541962.1 hypothetical protein [Bacillus glycinifermentans]